MARLSCILSIALLVAHLMVGCCACHAHSFEGKHTSSATQSNTTCQGQFSECISDHPQHASRQCHGCRCSLASLRRPVGGPLSLLFKASIAIRSIAHSRRLAINLHKDPCATARLLLPVRFHLANQVLLI